ncbi:CLUMA_CG002805, isoform A [Clunio marinus]|uniref:CLUMA_CG002805, isoform A n=1 Tax=Clunio marinus TaxID=568069 RepID=A0A1J1HSA0_9DIPT|nr:CLUMA_CG002805, isoform A [Clunio marinus]
MHIKRMCNLYSEVSSAYTSKRRHFVIVIKALRKILRMFVLCNKNVEKNTLMIIVRSLFLHVNYINKSLHDDGEERKQSST